jgi:hypothetical protein
MKRNLLFITFFLLAFLESQAQISYDGTISESNWGSALATSGAGCAGPGFGAGHEINAIYVSNDGISNNNIILAVAGNVQNGNRIIVFLDTKTGGFNNGSFNRTNAPGGIANFNSGTSFDAGFNADYALVIGTNAAHDNFFVDLFTLTSGTGSNIFLGSSTANPSTIGASPANSDNTKGFEIAIPKSNLGFVNGASISVFAMYTGESGFLSNQFLTCASSGDGNYAGGAVSFGSASPNPITVSATALTVELTRFDAKTTDNHVKLSWETATETNNKTFQIERSLDAENWFLIAEMAGAGNSRDVLQYQFTDLAPLAGTSFYRLRQIDFDGLSSLSPVRQIERKTSETVSIYPNPVKNGHFVVSTMVENETDLRVDLLDMMGRVVRVMDFTAQKGENNLEFLTNNLPEGMYSVRLFNGTSEVTSQKISIKNR